MLDNGPKRTTYFIPSTKDLIDPGCWPPPWWLSYEFRPYFSRSNAASKRVAQGDARPKPTTAVGALGAPGHPGRRPVAVLIDSVRLARIFLWHITARPYRSEGREAPLKLRDNKVWAFAEGADGHPAVLAWSWHVECCALIPSRWSQPETLAALNIATITATALVVIVPRPNRA